MQRVLTQLHIPIFPRPKRVPKDFKIRFSEKGAGIKYIDPKNNHTYIRVIPGASHTEFPAQQKPYIRYVINGKDVDKHRREVLRNSAQEHIKLEEFQYVKQ